MVTLAIAVICCVHTTPAVPQGLPQTLSATEIYKRVSPSVPTIFSDSLDGGAAIGSGFVISKNRVVTCWHVVMDAKQLFVQFPNTKPIRARIVDANTDADIAILEAESTAIPLSVRKGRPEPGERLYAIGSPEGLSGSIFDGLMSQIRRNGDQPVYQVSIPVTHGNSGGPVVDAFGRVIGMVSSGFEGVQSLSFAVPISQILASKLSKPAMDIELFRETSLPNSFTLIGRPRTGDEFITRSKTTLKENGATTILRAEDGEKILKVEGGLVTLIKESIQFTIEKGGETTSPPKRTYRPFTEDLFGNATDLESQMATLDTGRYRAFRMMLNYIPPSVGSLIQVGQSWTIELPSKPGVPGAKYTAKFEGFEAIKGVRCAKIESLFIEIGNDPAPLRWKRTRWVVQGGVEIRVHEEGPMDSVRDAELVYWKFGPEHLRTKPVGRNTK